MNVLCFDVGSSSVKAAIVTNGRLRGKARRVTFATSYTSDRAEVKAESVLRAMAEAVHEIGSAAKRVDLIAMTAMSPSWLAMDRRGKALTPIITHQDRRSVKTAEALLERLGAARWLNGAGNLPFPGGISATTWRWFIENEKQTIARADLVGHLQTYVHRQFNGSRIIDPSNASFTGLYLTLSQGGWSDALCQAVGANMRLLPQIVEADEVAGFVTRTAATRFGLTPGTPMLAGCIDTSAAMYLTGAKPGQLLNISGSTDVLALCTDKPRPHPKLLTRALGTGKRWMSVSTLAAVGSALNWMRDQFFADLSDAKYFKLVDALALDAGSKRRGVTFDAYLAGDRTSIEQRHGAFSGLTLATTRDDMLAAVLDSLAVASAARMKLLRTNDVPIRRDVVIGGGSATGGLEKALYRDWPGKWRFKSEPEAGLRGLYRMSTQK